MYGKTLTELMFTHQVAKCLVPGAFDSLSFIKRQGACVEHHMHHLGKTRLSGFMAG
jgi:hypothetical protein